MTNPCDQCKPNCVGCAHREKKIPCKHLDANGECLAGGCWAWLAWWRSDYNNTKRSDEFCRERG